VQPAPGGGTCASAPCSDAFVAKLSKGDSALVYGTYLGGKGDDVARGIAVDQAGEATVTGSTASSDFPVYGAQQAAFGGGQSDAFIARLSQTGSALVYSTYLGGSSSDEGLAIALDRTGDAFVAGRTASGDFPVASALQAGTGGRTDAFVARVGGALTPTPAAPAPAASASITPAGTSTVTPLPSATPTRTPGPSPTPVTEVSVISVRVEKIKARADWQLEHPSMKRAWVGTTVLLSIYYAVTRAHPADQVTAQWSVTQGGRVVYRRVARRRLNSPTAGLYRIKTRFTPRRLGTYAYVGRVTVRGTTDAGTTTVTAVSRPAGRKG
jgi:hypothetical protein